MFRAPVARRSGIYIGHVKSPFRSSYRSVVFVGVECDFLDFDSITYIFWLMTTYTYRDASMIS